MRASFILLPALHNFITKIKVEIMNTLKNTKGKKIGKINFFFVFLLFISFFIHTGSKAQSKIWVVPKEADNVKNPLAGNTGV